MEFLSLEAFDQAFFARYGGEQREGTTETLWAANVPATSGPPEVAGRMAMLQKAYSIASVAIMVLLAAVIVAFVAPLPFGVKMLNVQSGSMASVYPIDTLVWIVPTKFEKIKVYDDITYVINNGNTFVTHRVQEIDTENQIFTTKGTDNSAFSEQVPFKDVQGVVRFHMKGMGKTMETLNSREGVYIKVLIVLAAVAFYFMPRFLFKRQS